MNISTSVFRLHMMQTVGLVWSYTKTEWRKDASKHLEWCSPGRRRKGRPRILCELEVTTRNREKGIRNIKWIDREEWRRKIKIYEHKNVIITYYIWKKLGNILYKLYIKTDSMCNSSLYIRQYNSSHSTNGIFYIDNVIELNRTVGF
jgi:hypothetical protein